MTENIYSNYGGSEEIKISDEEWSCLLRDAGIAPNRDRIASISNIVDTYYNDTCLDSLGIRRSKAAEQIDYVLSCTKQLYDTLINLDQFNVDDAGVSFAIEVALEATSNNAISDGNAKAIRANILLNTLMADNLKNIVSSGEQKSCNAAVADLIEDCLEEWATFYEGRGHIHFIVGVLHDLVMALRDASSRIDGIDLGASSDIKLSKFLVDLFDLYKEFCGEKKMRKEFMNLALAITQKIAADLTIHYGLDKNAHINRLNDPKIRSRIKAFNLRNKSTTA